MTGYLTVLFVLAVGIIAGFIGRGAWDKRQAKKAQGQAKKDAGA